jgi:hypothetical protein
MHHFFHFTTADITQHHGPYHQEKTNFVPSFQYLRTAAELRRMPVVILTSDQPCNLKTLGRGR